MHLRVVDILWRSRWRHLLHIDIRVEVILCLFGAEVGEARLLVVGEGKLDIVETHQIRDQLLIKILAWIHFDKLFKGVNSPECLVTEAKKN